MLELYEISLLLIAHFIGDFLLQTDKQAKGKSSSNILLTEHIASYIIPFVLIGFLIPISLAFLVVTFLTHFATDWISSRITKKLWVEQKVHWFFAVIGADQLVHALTLIWTYYYFSWYF